MNVDGYQYKNRIDIDTGEWSGPYSEDPVYATFDFPGVKTGEALIGYKGEAIIGNLDRFYEGNLTIIFSSNTSMNTALTVYGSDPCKGNQLQIVDSFFNSFGKHIDHYSFQIRGGEAVKIDVSTKILSTGYQFITFVFCSPQNTKVTVDGSLKFRNPYGYLPSSVYGYLPFNALLALLYFILALVYGILAIRYRDSILKIHVFIFLVILMGLVETTTWFLTFVLLNETGEPPCCPPRSDILFALGTSNLKRTVSAVLILAVCIGWGVAQPTLDLSTNFKIITLGLVHFAFSINSELKRIEAQSKINRDDAGAIWSIPVAVCNVIFVFWIYVALERVQEELQQLRQTAKLEMYKRLSRTLAIWVWIWVAYTFFLILVNSKTIQLSWKYDFILPTFWDLLYFGILLSIARIWIPSHASSAYAYSQQIPTTDNLDEFDSSALEMSAPAQASTFSFAAPNTPDKVAHIDENDEDDVEIDIGLDDGPSRGKKKVVNT